VSKNFTCLGKRLNKAIPHLKSFSILSVNLKYKIIGDFRVCRVFWLVFGFAFLEKFKLRLSCACKLRLSGVAFCFFGCFFDLGFERFCGLRLLGLGAGLAGGFCGLFARFG
jgi:hypothetical protein